MATATKRARIVDARSARRVLPATNGNGSKANPINLQDDEKSKDFDPYDYDKTKYDLSEADLFLRAMGQKIFMRLKQNHDSFLVKMPSVIQQNICSFLSLVDHINVFARVCRALLNAAHFRGSWCDEWRVNMHALRNHVRAIELKEGKHDIEDIERGPSMSAIAMQFLGQWDFLPKSINVYCGGTLPFDLIECLFEVLDTPRRQAVRVLRIDHCTDHASDVPPQDQIERFTIQLNSLSNLRDLTLILRGESGITIDTALLPVPSQTIRALRLCGVGLSGTSDNIILTWPSLTTFEYDLQASAAWYALFGSLISSRVFVSGRRHGCRTQVRYNRCRCATCPYQPRMIQLRDSLHWYLVLFYHVHRWAVQVDSLKLHPMPLMTTGDAPDAKTLSLATSSPSTSPSPSPSFFLNLHTLHLRINSYEPRDLDDILNIAFAAWRTLDTLHISNTLIGEEKQVDDAPFTLRSGHNCASLIEHLSFRQEKAQGGQVGRKPQSHPYTPRTYTDQPLKLQRLIFEGIWFSNRDQCTTSLVSLLSCMPSLQEILAVNINERDPHVDYMWTQHLSEHDLRNELSQEIDPAYIARWTSKIKCIRHNGPFRSWDNIPTLEDLAVEEKNKADAMATAAKKAQDLPRQTERSLLTPGNRHIKPRKLAGDRVCDGSRPKCKCKLWDLAAA